MARILLVDDEAALRRLVRRILEPLGHTIFEAPHGRAGVMLMRQRLPDLLITDIVMPNMDGIEMIVEIRKEFPAVRILALSGGGVVQGSMAYLHAASTFGADATLGKPFLADKLIKVVDELLAPQPG